MLHPLRVVHEDFVAGVCGQKPEAAVRDPGFDGSCLPFGLHRGAPSSKGRAQPATSIVPMASRGLVGVQGDHVSQMRSPKTAQIAAIVM
jgi:hypothetical protein